MPIALTLSDSELAALDRYIADRGNALSREAALAEIVREALGSGPAEQSGDEGLRPDELNASNDS